MKQKEKPVLKTEVTKKQTITDKPNKTKLSEQSVKAVITDSPIELSENSIKEENSMDEDVNLPEKIEIDDVDISAEKIITKKNTDIIKEPIINVFTTGFKISEIKNEEDTLLNKKTNVIEEKAPVTRTGKHYDGGIYF